MNRAELVEQIAIKTGTSKASVERSLAAFLHVVTKAVAKGEKVTLVGFGTFERRNRKARTGRNPRTLAPLKIAEARVPAFRAGSELKELVNRGASIQSQLPGDSTTRPDYLTCPRCNRVYVRGTTHRCPHAS